MQLNVHFFRGGLHWRAPFFMPMPLFSTSYKLALTHSNYMNIHYLNFNYDSNNSAAKKKFDEIFEDLSKLIPIQNHRGRTEVGSITYHF